MSKILCGSTIYLPNHDNNPGTGGCLVRFTAVPERLLMLTAGHVVVGMSAKQFDPVEAKELQGTPFGVLLGWTGLGYDVTTDAALVQVDPALVDASITTIGPPKGTNLDPTEGQTLFTYAMGRHSSGRILHIGVEREIQVIRPDNTKPLTVTYKRQILCEKFGENGMSGAVALDGNNQVVGLIVAAGNDFTLVTPIDAVLNHPDWGEDMRLEVLGTVPPDVRAPHPVPPPPSIPHGANGTPPVGMNNEQLADAQQALNYFTKAGGWTRDQALGLVANMMKEDSTFDPKRKGDQNLPKPSYGLFQWRGKRVDIFRGMHGFGIEQATTTEQMAYADWELHNTFAKVGADLAAARSPGEAARLVCINYEVPADKYNVAEARAKLAEQLDRTLA